MNYHSSLDTVLLIIHGELETTHYHVEHLDSVCMEGVHVCAYTNMCTIQDTLTLFVFFVTSFCKKKGKEVWNVISPLIITHYLVAGVTTALLDSQR